MINRRAFVVAAGALAAFKFGSESVAAGSNGSLLGIAANIPSRIFFPNTLSVEPVLLKGLRLIDRDSAVLCVFSNGQTIHLDATSSYLDGIRATQGHRITRQSVVLKSLAAWVIDAVWESLHNRRDAATQMQLRTSYESFQKQSVLDAVTPTSLYFLLRDISLHKQVRMVVWKKELSRFEVK
jgi:hypothetical protein